MKISLFQGILFAVFGLGALIGLFVFATYSGSTKSSTTQVGTITIWGTLPKDGMNATLTSAAQIDQNLKSVSYVQKDPTTLKEGLATAIATGQAPDLVLISQEQLNPLLSLLQPVSPTTLSARVFSTAFAEEGELFQSAQGAYGVPFLIDPLVLFWNRTTFSSAGLSTPPSTWEALTGLVPHVAQLSNTKQVIRALIALGTYTNVHDARAILSTLFLQTGLPITSYATNGVLSASLSGNSSTGIPPGEAVLRFYTQFADPTKVSYTWDDSQPDSEQAFVSGNVALYLGFASEASYLRAANPNLDFDVVPVPQPATALTKTTYGLVYALSIPRGAKNPSGAYQAAALLSNTAEQQAAASYTALAPASRTALATTPTNPIAAIAYTSALYAKGWLSPAPSDTDQIFGTMIENVISGRSTLTAALNAAEQSLNSLLQ